VADYLVGAGGWAYYQIPGLHPLVAYSQAFNFVEVNSTFYQLPTLREATRWRELVPPDFHFAVRAHRTITHKHKLQPTEEALETLEKMKQICDALKADVLHLQSPPSFKLTKTSIAGIGSLLASANPKQTRIALELRGADNKKLPSDLISTMQDNNVVHCVDLSKDQTPAYQSDMLYSRLFGKGQHNVYQPTDDELADIDKKATAIKAEKITMSFHFVRMYKDAARMKIYKQTGKFSQITDSTGLASLEEVLSEDAAFPTTKQQLIDSQGWKLYDATENQRLHTSVTLRKLPDRTYNDTSDVIDALRSMAG